MKPGSQAALRPPFDLHLHSNASDGSLSPTAMAERCVQAGVRFAALTDHDTVGGVAEARRAGKALGLPVFAGVELSAQFAGELHILGYGVDENHPALGGFLARQRRRRLERVPQMVENLKRAGVVLSEEEILKKAGGEVAGRLHVAQALVDRGAAANVKEAFERYLVIGRPGYAPRDKAPVRRCIEIIAEAGGQAVWAHPGLMDLSAAALAALAAGFRDYGLVGLEVYYPAHGPATVAELASLADRFGLVRTYGSDSHGDSHGDVLQDWPRFAHEIPLQTYQWLKQRIKE